MVVWNLEGSQLLATSRSQLGTTRPQRPLRKRICYYRSLPLRSVSHMDDWITRWIRLRKEAGLPVSGTFNGALQPAPDVQRDGSWLTRPLACSQMTLILRSMLQSSDRDLTSHSLKVTGLSWSAKAEIPREQRRLLGRHASSLQDADSIYSRDLSFAPVCSGA